ncbi:MAG: energy transducer TonB [Saprospiraceae bacterium]
MNSLNGIILGIFSLMLLETTSLFGQSFEVLKECEEMPLFPSDKYEDDMTYEEKSLISQKTLIEHIFTSIRYPAKARENKIQGTVIVEFIITKEGFVKDAHLTKTIGGGCDEESLRMINELNETVGPWIPGRQDGKAVNVEYKFPFRFKME